VPVEDALRAATMPPAAARRAAETLAGLGFDTSLDLELLGGGEAAAEVLAELKAGGLGPADRAKVRLLVGDRAHLRELSSPALSSAGTLAAVPAAAHSHARLNTSLDSVHSGANDALSIDEDTTTQRRNLQSSGGGGMSADTIAIVLSVLVGAAGYVLQAHTARRAERVQEQQAMEQHATEQARQREHQVMTAQIERTHQALDKCCRPIQNDVMTICNTRLTAVYQIVSKLEASHSDAVEEMLSFATTMELNPSDGVVTSRSSGRLLWTPNSSPELTRALSDVVLFAPSGPACAIGGQDFLVMMSKPFCGEMPTVILDIIAAEPMGEIGDMYRSFVRHTMMPLFRLVLDTLRQYAACKC
jgi:hypothetical protein